MMKDDSQLEPLENTPQDQDIPSDAVEESESRLEVVATRLKDPRTRYKISLIILGACSAISFILGGSFGFMAGKYFERERNMELQDRRLKQNEHFQEILTEQGKRKVVIDQIHADLEACRKRLFEGTGTFQKTFAALDAIPDETVIWSNRVFYGTGKVNRKESVQYTVFSDPLNPREVKETISFTLDHGTPSAPPSNALVKKKLSKNLLLEAVPATGSERVSDKGCAVEVTVRSIAAKNTKARFAKKKETMNLVMKQKTEAYEKAKAEAEKKIKALTKQ